MRRKGYWIALTVPLVLLLSLSMAAAEAEKKTVATAADKLERVNINTADIDTLTTLKGVGPTTAERIIAYRKEAGKFNNIEDLMQVKGIGEKTFEALKPFITVGK
jgi:competence protein ComEA